MPDMSLPSGFDSAQEQTSEDYNKILEEYKQNTQVELAFLKDWVEKLNIRLKKVEEVLEANVVRGQITGEKFYEPTS